MQYFEEQLVVFLFFGKKLRTLIVTWAKCVWRLLKNVTKSNFELSFLDNTNLMKDWFSFPVFCGQYQTIVDYANGKCF